MALSDLASQYEPDSRAARLCAEEWDKQIRRRGKAMPLVFHDQVDKCARPAPGQSYAPSRLLRRFHPVADQVDEGLLELSAIGHQGLQSAV